MTEMYGFDQPLPDSAKQNEVLPQGVYWFRVTQAEKRIWDKGKLAGAPYMRITLELWDEKTESEALENLTLHSKTVWNVRAFWEAVGETVPAGQVFMPPWNSILGATGKCKVKPRQYVDSKNQSKTVNSIEAWVKPDGSQPPPRNADESAANNGVDDMPF